MMTFITQINDVQNIYFSREYGKGLPHKKPIASETDARKMQSFARLGGLKEAPTSIGSEYFTCVIII